MATEVSGVAVRAVSKARSKALNLKRSEFAAAGSQTVLIRDWRDKRRRERINN